MAPPAKEHPSRSLVWALVESGGLSLLSLAVLLVVARWAGPGDLGAFAIALGIVQILTMIVEMLVHDAIVQRSRLTPDHLHTAFWTCLCLGALLSVGCWLAAPRIGEFFSSPQVGELLSIAGISLVFTGAGCVPIAVLRREMRFRPIAIRSLGGRLCGAIVAIVMAAMHFGVWSLVAQYMVQTFVCTLLVWPSSPWRPAFAFSPGKLRELMAFGSLSVGTRLIWTAGGKIFTLLLGNFLGVTAVGYLNIAQRLVDTLFDLLAGAAHNLALPIFSRRQEDRASLVRAYVQATEFCALATTPLYGGLALCAAPIIVVLLGESWLPAAPLVWVLAGGAMMQFLFLFGPTTLTALGRPGIVLVFSLWTLSFVLIVFFLVRPDNVVEAAAIWAARIFIGAPLLHFTICRILKTSPLVLVKAVWVPLAATLAMAATLLLVGTYVLATAPALLKLMTMIPLGALVYGTVVILAGRRSLFRLLDFGLAAVRRKPSLGS
jgi:PST family polysaccharide transporter